MPQKPQTVQYFFEAGHKVQLKRKDLERLHATITRVELFPEPLEFETQEDWDNYHSYRVVYFWVKLDDFPELHDYYKHHEVQCRYRELQPLSPRMTEAQLARYCKQRFVKEQNEQRANAYFQVMRYLDGEKPSYPLSLAPFLLSGHSVDLINLFVSWGACMRQKAQEIREISPGRDTSDVAVGYETQAQVYDTLRDLLLPQRGGAQGKVGYF